MSGRVNVHEGTIRLLPGATKNKRGRLVYMPDELLEVLRKEKRLRDLHFPDCPWVFHKEGKQIRFYRRAWTTACKRVGLEGRLFHDFRRTAVRNLVRAGVPERVAMEISGHRTRSVFERYNIVNEQDLKEAAKAVSAYNFFRRGHKMGTIGEIEAIIKGLKSS